MVQIGIKHLFEHIIKSEFEFSEKLNTREFIHIYDFQKYFLYKSIRRLTGLVKMKQYHYWNEKRNIATWQQMGKIKQKFCHFFEEFNTLSEFRFKFGRFIV